MVNWGRISVRLHLLTFGIALTIFVIGVFVGTTLTSERTQYLQDAAYQQTMDYNSLQLQSLYLDLNANNASCSTFNHILEESLSKVGDAQSKVDFYLKEEEDDPNYALIKRNYAITQIRYWLLNDRIETTCKSEHNAILYFYSNDECDDCGAQGTILINLKERLGDDLLVFSLDKDFTEEPMIGVMIQQYNITEVPSLVINGKRYSGLQERDSLLEDFCANYDTPPEVCAEYTAN